MKNPLGSCFFAFWFQQALDMTNHLFTSCLSLFWVSISAYVVRPGWVWHMCPLSRIQRFKLKALFRLIVIFYIMETLCFKEPISWKIRFSSLFWTRLFLQPSNIKLMIFWINTIKYFFSISLISWSPMCACWVGLLGVTPLLIAPLQ